MYAYGQIHRAIRDTLHGSVIDESGKSVEGNIYHNFDSAYEDSQGSDRLNAETGSEIKFFDSWEKAIAEIPYSVSYPDSDYPVHITVQDNIWFSVEALYTVAEDKEFSIQYSFFQNKNWEVETEYNGEILERSTFVNEYGCAFEKITVALDQNLYVNYVIAYDDKMVQVQFKNLPGEEQEIILNQLDLGSIYFGK